jgi:hypothetical protein
MSHHDVDVALDSRHFHGAQPQPRSRRRAQLVVDDPLQVVSDDGPVGRRVASQHRLDRD